MQQAAVNHAVDQATPEASEGPQCKCSRDLWVWVMMGLSIGASGLVILVSVLSLMNMEGGLQGIMLDVYLVILCLIVVTAELRRLSFLRPIIYWWIKYVYFLTRVPGRSGFYFFVGTIVIDSSSPLNIAAAAFMILVSVMYLVVNCVYDLPVYPDAQVVKAEQEARRRQAYAQEQANAASAPAPGGPAPGTMPPPPEYEYSPPKM